MSTTFMLNGVSTTLDADPAMPLLWAIREVAGLHGTKFGCGMALCGACTVHVDGDAVRSCVMPLGSVAGKQVTTIEGLQSKPAKPVQAAWIGLQLPQCGYCQSGQVMSATALLEKNAVPSNADIDGAMSGNIMESTRILGVCYAASVSSCGRRRSGYQRSKLVRKSSLRAWTRICNRRWAPRGVHRICCLLTNRLATS